jgi:DnaJ homolog subfamily A member 2
MKYLEQVDKLIVIGRQGGNSGASVTCQTCQGTGIEITLRPLGPGMEQQFQSVCSACNGEGKVINTWDCCKTCKGKKVVTETKVLEVHVDKGMKEGQKILFRGESDQQVHKFRVAIHCWRNYITFCLLQPGMEAGDLVIILQQKSHELFKRQGDDLYMTHTITPTEAKCGFTHVLKVLVYFTQSIVYFALRLIFIFCSQHLDGRDLVIRHPPDNILEPGSTKMVPGEGMPRYRSPLEKGELYIKIVSVEYEG